MLTAIRNWVIRTMMKSKGETGIVRTLPNKDLIELNTQITAQRLMQNGIDPQLLKNADQVENAIIAIESKPKTGGVINTKSAKVFDMEGKEIPKGSKIMGGKAIDDDLPPPGSRGGPDDIAAPTQSEDEILEKLNRENKEARRNLQIKLSKDKGYQKFKGETEEEIRKRFGLDDPEDMAQGGRAGFSNGGIDVLKLEDEALQRAINAFKYYQSMGGKKNFRDYIKESGRFGDQFRAEGGRIGYKIGSIDKARRAFLKTVGAAGAGITALKTGLLGLGKEAAPMVEAAKETVTQAPSYFFDLVAKIKLFGKQRQTPSYKERVNEFTYTGKNGDQYELIEDLDTGEIMIQKDKMGVGVSGDKSFDVINDRTEMRYKKPKPDEGDPNPSEEYEEYKVEFDQDGTAADASQIDEISKKEIIEEVTEDAPSIKKASGGIARMLGE